MSINVFKLSISVAIAVGLVWSFCFLAVLIAPELAAVMMEHMMHLNMDTMEWQLSIQSFLVGGAIWMVFALAITWLSARIYLRGSSQQ